MCLQHRIADVVSMTAVPRHEGDLWLQVLDMLLAADVSLADPMLPSLFRVGRVADKTFRLLEKIIRPDGQPQPSSQLLIDIASRGSQFSSWSSVCTVPREALVLISVDKDRQTRRRFSLRFQGLVFRIQLPPIKLEPSIGKSTIRPLQ